VPTPETITYTLLAKGDKNNDTLNLEQEVYKPDLFKLWINPGFESLYEKRNCQHKME
jgi:hypothetical protein